MDTVERIKELCKERGIAISRLEKDLGFANGYFGGLKKGSLPADRLQKVADYFDVSPSYLMNGEHKSAGYYISMDTVAMAQELLSNRDLKLLFDAAKNATPEQLKLLQQIAKSWGRG